MLGPRMPKTAWTDAAVSTGDKGQRAVERGGRLRKDPVGVVSSLLVKKPSRVPGLWMVMTLAFLVSAGAQRRMRHPLARHHATLPTQSGAPTPRPTLRWIVQLVDGVNRVVVALQGHVQVISAGLTDLRRKILRLFGQKVRIR